MLTNCQ